MNFIRTAQAFLVCSTLIAIGPIYGIKTMNTASLPAQHNSPFLLRFLYTTKIGTFLRKIVYTGWINRIAGKYCDSRFSKRHIAGFVKKHAINMDEAEKQISEFHSFNDFFTRTLKPEARPVDTDPSAVVSPADGAMLVMENISCHQTRFVIKKASFNLTAFLADEQLAQEYEGGTLVIIRLAPYDYHRFHFPLDCRPAQAQRIKGVYDSVDPLTYACGIQPLVHNERRLCILEKTAADTILLMSVGALCVGKIKESYKPGIPAPKGQEAGYFLFGGSTIVLIFKRGSITINDYIKDNSLNEIETPIKMGVKFGALNYKDSNAL